jgi:hypothetical protein
MTYKNPKKHNVIFSVDTEHDIAGKYETRTAGWSKGIPALFDLFDTSGLRGKVCWLIEYNIKDGLPAANPQSELFCGEFPELITQIKNRGDEIGLHPTMCEYLGEDRDIPVSSYNDQTLWGGTRRYDDPQYVIDLITSATREVKKACGINPVGCRTGAFQYATHLATALEKNGIYLDSSVAQGLRQWVTAPNAYYAANDDIRNKADTQTGVLEIPTAGYVYGGWLNLLLKLKTWYLLCQRQPIFLSFYIHNWQAITANGMPDKRFLGSLSSFLRFLSNRGVNFLCWEEAREIYKDIYKTAIE